MRNLDILIVILNELKQQEKVKIKSLELSKKTRYSQQSICRKLIELEKFGYIEREVLKSGIIINLTKQGKNYLKKIKEILGWV